MAIPGVRGILLKKICAKLVAVFGGNVSIGGLILGGAAINKEVEQLMHEMKFPYLVGYGMTECAPLIGYRGWRNFVMRSCGAVAHPSVEVRIDSENPAEIPGEIQVKGDAVMVGYYKNEKATNDVFTEDGWLKTGDMGTMDADGTIYIKGRSKTMILTANGQNVYPEEIESKLNNMPYVMESLIVERDGKIVGLVYPDYDKMDTDGMTRERLPEVMEVVRKDLNKLLAPYEQVTKIQLFANEFEKTPKRSIKRFLYTN